tara:strand:+ start:1069 stop:2127 length:1059 start_codon:yes stop_codon:yes gene_type:complete
MAKKTTTTPNLGARGQANINIIAAAGQRFAPVKTDISGYMKALGATAEVLIKRRENAIQREQDIDLSNDIVGSEEFKNEIEKTRELAAEQSRIMKNTLPFTKKHKDAKKEFERLKGDIKSFDAQFKVIDQISTNLGGMVEDGKIKMSIGEDDIKQNYYLALYNKDFEGGFDPDGDGPEPAVPFFKLENGKLLMINESGDYVDPKVVKVNFKQSGDTTLAGTISDLVGSFKNTRVDDGTRKNSIGLGLGDIKNYIKDNPVESNEHFMTKEYSLESEDRKSFTFMDYYLSKLLDDGSINQEGMSEKLIKTLQNFDFNAASLAAKQSLFKSIKQYDTDFLQDVEDFYNDYFNTFE